MGTKVKLKAKAPAKTKFVLVCTENRGVFAGEMSAYDSAMRSITLKNARMCVYWARSIRGVVGLAKTGPDSSCRITPAAPSMLLEKVTAVMDCTKEAVVAWEKEPWSA